MDISIDGQFYLIYFINSQVEGIIISNLSINQRNKKNLIEGAAAKSPQRSHHCKQFTICSIYQKCIKEPSAGVSKGKKV